MTIALPGSKGSGTAGAIPTVTEPPPSLPPPPLPLALLSRPAPPTLPPLAQLISTTVTSTTVTSTPVSSSSSAAVGASSSVHSSSASAMSLTGTATAAPSSLSSVQDLTAGGHHEDHGSGSTLTVALSVSVVVLAAIAAAWHRTRKRAAASQPWGHMRAHFRHSEDLTSLVDGGNVRRGACSSTSSAPFNFGRLGQPLRAGQLFEREVLTELAEVG